MGLDQGLSLELWNWIYEDDIKISILGFESSPASRESLRDLCAERPGEKMYNGA